MKFFSLLELSKSLSKNVAAQFRAHTGSLGSGAVKGNTSVDTTVDMQLWFDLLSFFQNHRGSLVIELGTVPPWRAATDAETGESCRLENCAVGNIVYRRETNVPGEDVHSCSLFLYQHLWDTTREVSKATLHSDCVAAPRCPCAGGRNFHASESPDSAFSLAGWAVLRAADLPLFAPCQESYKVSMCAECASIKAWKEHQILF